MALALERPREVVPDPEPTPVVFEDAEGAIHIGFVERAAPPPQCYHGLMTTAQQILEEALQLNEDERVVVANSLLESVEAPPPDRRSDEEWIAEIERRARAALAGSPGLTWVDARARVEKRLDLR